GKFQVEEVFLGNAVKGQQLALPGFQLMWQDPGRLGMERFEPIQANTRILMFLKPIASLPASPIFAYGRHGEWAVAAGGLCYFWTDSTRIESLRKMAASAVKLRRSWEAARDVPDLRKRVEALWPFLWSPSGCCYSQTLAEFQKVGPIAGDYIAEQLSSIDPYPKSLLLATAAMYHSDRLHTALVRELKRQWAAWERLLHHWGGFANLDDVTRPRGPDSRTAFSIYSVLYAGLEGLAGYRDRSDLPFIRESALWAVQFRFKQPVDAALKAFA